MGFRKKGIALPRGMTASSGSGISGGGTHGSLGLAVAEEDDDEEDPAGR